MALHTDNMAEVPDQGELVDEGNYHVRVSKVEEKESDAGKPMVVFELKIQDEGKHMGRPVYLTASLQSHALFTLKKVYTAVGYQPGPEGHDPEKVLDGEFYVTIKHKEFENKQGQKQKGHDMPLWGIRSLSQGPAKDRS